MVKKIILLIIIITIILFSVFYIAKPVASGITGISIKPEIIYPGDPVMITVTASSTVLGIYYDNKIVSKFIYNKKTTSLIAIPFEEKNLKHKVVVRLSNGMVLEKGIGLTERVKIVKPLGIPEKLGGNTPQASKKLVSNLSIENARLNNITSLAKSLKAPAWNKPFGLPLVSIFITDDYGYNRDTVGNNIVHKGTDYRAQEGTDVLAMNKGKVIFADKFTVYGNTIIIDHGLGLSTMYMHLSKINVKIGDMVEKGNVIGQSGMTGYAESPHLHVSVKINGVSIDPAKFIALFNVL
jgi:murein DD-endopeptidase MepM/ murein hydrolase activator NlpD